MLFLSLKSLSFGSIIVSAIKPVTLYPSASTFAIIPSSPMISEATSAPVPISTEWLLAAACVTIASGHEEGLFVPNKIAWSIAIPKASTICGLTSPQILNAESDNVASGIGIITANSSAVRVNFFHSAFDVFFESVSPFKKYALASAFVIGIVFCEADIFGNLFIKGNSLDACGTSLIISFDISTGINASAFVLKIALASVAAFTAIFYLLIFCPQRCV